MSGTTGWRNPADLQRHSVRSVMARDYYQEAETLARFLELEGDHRGALSIRSAIEDGSTATEILMALRFRAQEIIAEGRPENATTRIRVREFVDALNAALS